jgi:hypothetical protein
MIQVILTKASMVRFNRTLKEYVKLNRRATAGLVEHTAKKVITGYSPRSPSAKKVKGLRHTYYDKRATATKIKAEARQRASQGKGTLRPPSHAVSKKAVGLYRGIDSKKTWKWAVRWRSKRGTAWLQSTMLYKQWRPTSTEKNKTLKPSLSKQHSGKSPPTKTYIRTKSKKPYVLWKSKVPGITKVKFFHRAVRRALRDGRADMLVYIRRKHQQIRMGR